MNEDVPDPKMKDFLLNDLMYILKDVHHTESDKFFNILNNKYLYNNDQLNQYFTNLDKYVLSRMQFFMKTLMSGCNNQKDQMIAVVEVLAKKNKPKKKKKKKTKKKAKKKKKK